MERDKVDKAAVGFDYKSQAEKHDSQKGEPQQPGELGKLGEVGDLGEQGKLRELDELEGLGVLEEMRNWGSQLRAGNRQCQGWSRGLPTGTTGHCAGLLQSARIVEELQGTVGNGSGEESHCTVHGCWKEFRLKEEEQKSSVGIEISWTAYHQRKGGGEAQAGANSSRHIPGQREGCCCSTSGDIWPCSMSFSKSWAQKTCEKSLNSHCCHLSPSLPFLFSSMP